MYKGFSTVAAVIPGVSVANPQHNAEAIREVVVQASRNGAEIIVTPELSITGYTCQDLFNNDHLLKESEAALCSLLQFSADIKPVIIVGMPVDVCGSLVNAAVVIQQGEILGIVGKTYLPNYGEFYEKRWFTSIADITETTVMLCGQQVTVTPRPQIFQTTHGLRFGIEICEDVWAPVPPSCHLALAGADVIFNLSASDELVGKHQYLRDLIRMHSARLICGYVYASAGFGESTQDVVYGGNLFVAENGHFENTGTRFSLSPQICMGQLDIETLRHERRANSTFSCSRKDMDAIIIPTKETSAENTQNIIRNVKRTPFIPTSDRMAETCSDILSIQSLGLVKRLQHTHCKNVVIGISGGLDSTLALLVTVKAFDMLHLDRKGIIGVTMPGFGTTGRTYNNALSLMRSLGTTILEIPIGDSVKQHFKDIDHDINNHDVTYENSQARERTQILMDLSNKYCGMVIGTGDLSELALGWCTYNGDHMSMYAVNAGVPKTLVKYLVTHFANTSVDETSKATLLDIVDTPISPELIPADENDNIIQKTEDLVGPYELHDFFLYHFMRHGMTPQRILALALRAFQPSEPSDASALSTSSSHSSEAVYDRDTIVYWLKVFCRRFFNQQFKRSCLPDGPKVGSVTLSPRGDWRMPSDASSAAWLSQFD